LVEVDKVSRLKHRNKGIYSVSPDRADVPGQNHCLTTQEVEVKINRYFAVRVLAEMGLLNNEIALVLNMTPETFAGQLTKDPQLKEALTLGKRKPDQQVQMSLFQSAMGYQYEEEAVEEEYDIKNIKGEEVHELISRRVKKAKKHQPANVAAQIFWLKNRLPEIWRDRVEATVTLRDRADLVHRMR